MDAPKRVQERTRKLLETNISLNRSNDELQQFAYVAQADGRCALLK